MRAELQKDVHHLIDYIQDKYKTKQQNLINVGRFNRQLQRQPAQRPRRTLVSMLICVVHCIVIQHIQLSGCSMSLLLDITIYGLYTT